MISNRRKLMDNLHRFTFTALALIGCASPLRYGRIASYQALPIASDEFDRLTTYTAVLIPKPFQLHVSERGNAWMVLVRRADGVIEQHVAVTYGRGAPVADRCPTFVGELLMILPGEPARYDGARWLLVAHDGTRCFGTDGMAVPCASSDAWSRAATLLGVPIASRGDSDADRGLRTWYARQLEIAGVRNRNTTLSDTEWRRMQWEESTWKDAADASPTALGGGIAAGILAGVVPGLIIGGVAFAVRFPMLLAEPARGAEYGDQPMPAEAVAVLADAVRQCGGPLAARTAQTE
jgi:hypothetical protein